MKRYREDKLYLAGLVGWGVIIANATGWYRVAAIAAAIIGIVLHRVNEGPDHG